MTCLMRDIATAPRNACMHVCHTAIHRGVVVIGREDSHTGFSATEMVLNAMMYTI